MGKQIFLRRMAPKLKKIDDEDKYIAMKEKRRLKEAEKRKKKNSATIIATEVTKATKITKLSDKLKMTTRAFAERRKKQVLRTSVQGDENEITSGQEEARPHLACPVLQMYKVSVIPQG